MLWVPPIGCELVQHNLGGVGSATLGVAVTTSGTSSTKGTVVELFSSTDFDVYKVLIFASNYGLAATASSGALDILTGAATEDVLIPNLLFGYCGALAQLGCGPKVWEFPLFIPKGTRIAAQAAGERTSTAVNVGMILYGGADMPRDPFGTKVTTYGMGTVPSGTSITPGASGAEGTWTQIVASTTEAHIALVPSIQVTSDTSMSVRALSVDLGIGAATEEEISQAWIYGTDGNEFISGPLNTRPCFRDIPASSRLAMRVGNSGTNDAGYNAVIHAVT